MCYFPDPSSPSLTILRDHFVVTQPRAGAKWPHFGGFDDDGGQRDETSQISLINSVPGTVLSIECEYSLWTLRETLRGRNRFRFIYR